MSGGCSCVQAVHIHLILGRRMVDWAGTINHESYVLTLKHNYQARPCWYIVVSGIYAAVIHWITYIRCMVPIYSIGIPAQEPRFRTVVIE